MNLVSNSSVNCLVLWIWWAFLDLYISSKERRGHYSSNGSVLLVCGGTKPFRFNWNSLFWSNPSPTPLRLLCHDLQRPERRPKKCVNKASNINLQTLSFLCLWLMTNIIIIPFDTISHMLYLLTLFAQPQLKKCFKAHIWYFWKQSKNWPQRNLPTLRL